MALISTIRFVVIVSFGFLMISCSAIRDLTQTPTDPMPAADVAPLDTREYLIRFHEDPNKILNARLPKRDESGNFVEPTAEAAMGLDSNDPRHRVFKDEVRRQFCLRAGIDCDSHPSGDTETFADVGDPKTVENFLYVMKIFKRPAEMETSKLTNHTLLHSPWSDSFWPINKGLIGRRFADPGYPGSKNWAQNFGYIQAWPAWTVAQDRMSPSEKYDYLVGDQLWTLTTRVWGKGQRYIDTYGFVPSWTGLCHGWAPASIVFERPMKAVTVPTFNGGQVTFSPSDIKALASLLWGESPPTVRFLGRRCKKFHPTDDEVGRTTNDSCFDVNPGAFHISIVNQLGVAKRSFVMDSTWDFEVWNYPIYAYQYHYFNPQTLAVSRSMAGMSVPVDRYTIDKFKKYRSPQAKSVLGIAMDVTYVIPTQPSIKVIEKDKHHTVRYIYDLELDASGTIIGGEWYSNFHPDFIWNPWPEFRALSKVEKEAVEPMVWDGAAPISGAIHEAARTSSGRTEPMAVIVERLVQLAAPVQTDPPLPGGETAEPEPEVDEPDNDPEVETEDDVGPVEMVPHN